MHDPGPLLASGRDADIFEYGPGLVLRRSRDGRSIAHEARTMAYLLEQGFPVPAVEEVSGDGRDLVMERIDGVPMVEAIARAPWTVRRQARMLAELHEHLHALPAPDFLGPAPVGNGSSILHLDLHPLNVLVGRKGPVVIDWSNTCVGDPDVDVALVWILMAAGDIPGGRVKAGLLGLGRELLVGGFMHRFDRAAVAGKLRMVATAKLKDPHMSEGEAAAMRRMVERAEARS
ncbi:MAG TPA: phosphotransferase [Acidimicrobiales bacterium]|nr:phosphotransferase [Acidimicrobiales bacterium]